MNSPNVSEPLLLTVGPPPDTTAVEFFNPGLGDYFLTSDAAEIAILDASPGIGWQRTGLSFPVFAAETAHSKLMCRFFGATNWAPKSSHFFTASDVECTLVPPVWKFEGRALRVAVLEETNGCMNGTQPLYRLFNNGQDGVPHHRYTTDLAVRAQMIGQGWVGEGAGIGVIACVPQAPP
ncbi:MAG: hypothetical protein ABI624_11190 [Casimicrobiaceae bacterium]